MRFVIVPGIDDSDSHHWQTIWQHEWGPTAGRIAPSSWSEPDLDDWVEAVDRAVSAAGTTDLVIIAHSLGCLAAAAWLSTAAVTIRGAFLAAPPDQHAPSFPVSASSFVDLEPRPVGVPGVVVTSVDDPYCRPRPAAALAKAWDLPVARAGALGHLNSASGLGGWQQGRVLLAKLLGATASAVA
ncbi:MAG TPA: alpha/beta hydrolase [Microlunatus sp.]|nr:alpha/beta hydrolase [Microlunatus sp.]